MGQAGSADPPGRGQAGASEAALACPGRAPACFPRAPARPCRALARTCRACARPCRGGRTPFFSRKYLTIFIAYLSFPCFAAHATPDLCQRRRLFFVVNICICFQYIFFSLPCAADAPPDRAGGPRPWVCSKLGVEDQRLIYANIVAIINIKVCNITYIDIAIRGSGCAASWARTSC